MLVEDLSHDGKKALGEIPVAEAKPLNPL